MARSMGIVVRAAPYGTISAAEALRHAVAGISFGISTTLFLLEDGVYVAQGAQDGERVGFTSLTGPLAQYARQEGTGPDNSHIRGRVIVHSASLLERGLSADTLVDGIEVVDDAGLAALLADCDAVLGY